MVDDLLEVLLRSQVYWQLVFRIQYACILNPYNRIDLATKAVTDISFHVKSERKIMPAVRVPIEVAPASTRDGRSCDVLVEGKDITWQTRTPEVEMNVSVVSAYRGVRAAMSEQQRRIGHRGKVVMVGRDIGTVVLPDADLKIYLDASAEERAKRRYEEIVARGGEADYSEILAKVKERDRIDSTRDVAPLRIPSDAVVLDSTHLSADEVFEQALALCK